MTNNIKDLITFDIIVVEEFLIFIFLNIQIAHSIKLFIKCCERKTLNFFLVQMFLSSGQDAVFKPPATRYGAAPRTAVGRCRRGDGEPGSWSDGWGTPLGPHSWKPYTVVHSGQLRDGVCDHDLVPGSVRRVCSELRHASARQELLVLTAERGHLQLPGCACTGLAHAHHAD